MNFLYYILVIVLAVFLATRQPSAAGWLTPLLGYMVAATAIGPLLPVAWQYYIPTWIGADCISLFAIALASRTRQSELATGYIFAASALLATTLNEVAQAVACLIAAAVFSVGFRRRARAWVWMWSAVFVAIALASEASIHAGRLAAWTRMPTTTDLEGFRWQAESYWTQWVTSAPFGPSGVDVEGHAELTTGWFVFLARIAGWGPALFVLALLISILALGFVVGLRSLRSHPQVLAVALVPSVFLVANLIIVFGLAPTFPVTPPPYSGPAGAIWLAVLIASVRAPIFVERPIELAEPLRHPLVYFGFASDREPSAGG